MPRVNVPSQCVVCRVKRLGGLPVDDAPRQRAGRKGNTTACEGQARGRRSDRSARRKSRQANTLLFSPPGCDGRRRALVWALRHGGPADQARPAAAGGRLQIKQTKPCGGNAPGMHRYGARTGMSRPRGAGSVRRLTLWVEPVRLKIDPWVSARRARGCRQGDEARSAVWFSRQAGQSERSATEAAASEDRFGPAPYGRESEASSSTERSR